MDISSRRSFTRLWSQPVQFLSEQIISSPEGKKCGGTSRACQNTGSEQRFVQIGLWCGHTLLVFTQGKMGKKPSLSVETSWRETCLSLLGACFRRLPMEK